MVKTCYRCYRCDSAEILFGLQCPKLDRIIKLLLSKWAGPVESVPGSAHCRVRLGIPFSLYSDWSPPLERIWFRAAFIQACSPKWRRSTLKRRRIKNTQGSDFLFEIKIHFLRRQWVQCHRKQESPLTSCVLWCVQRAFERKAVEDFRVCLQHKMWGGVRSFKA